MFLLRQIPQPAWLVSLLFASLLCALTLDVAEAAIVIGDLGGELLLTLLLTAGGYLAGTCFLIYALGSTRIFLIMSFVIPVLILDFLDLIERTSTDNALAEAHLVLFIFSWILMPIIIFSVRNVTRRHTSRTAA